jgi:SAM-dependent methyltransferase
MGSAEYGEPLAARSEDSAWGPGADALFWPGDLHSIDGSQVACFYANYLEERRSVQFAGAELTYLDDPKVLGRVIDPATRPFFAYHVGGNIARVVSALVNSRTRPRLLEVGCGSGTVSLMLALGGATVVALDSNPVAIDACRRRQAFYESRFGPLALEFRLGDAMAFPYTDLGPLDGIYSVFAFNLIQPTRALLDLLVPSLVPGGVFVIGDGNQQSIASRRLLSGPGLTPDALENELRARGLHVTEVQFGGLIPAPLARVTPIRRAAEQVERRLLPRAVLGRVAASFTLAAEKPR